jgi:hypothetical protein
VPRSHDGETPKFCLRYLAGDFDLLRLPQKQQAAFATTPQKLAQIEWRTITTSSRHGSGSEFIPRQQVGLAVPVRFEDTQRFIALRYDGKLPMLGVCVEAVFHVRWIAANFDELYSHGS